MKKNTIFSVLALLTIVSSAVGATQFHSTTSDIFLHPKPVPVSTSALPSSTLMPQTGVKDLSFGMQGQVFSRDLFKQRTNKGISYGLLVDKSDQTITNHQYRGIASMCAYQTIEVSDISLGKSPKKSPPPPTPPINPDDDDKILPVGDAMYPLLLMAFVYAVCAIRRRFQRKSACETRKVS